MKDEKKRQTALNCLQVRAAAAAGRPAEAAAAGTACAPAFLGSALSKRAWTYKLRGGRSPRSLSVCFCLLRPYPTLQPTPGPAQTFKEELKSSACRDKVHRKMMRAARDIRFDDVLANACQEDRKTYCNDVQPVSHPAGRDSPTGDAAAARSSQVVGRAPRMLWAAAEVRAHTRNAPEAARRGTAAVSSCCACKGRGFPPGLLSVPIPPLPLPPPSAS
jgi:hypothetical protein